MTPTTPTSARTWPGSPRLLDRADAFIAEGVLGRDEISAGDLQVGASLRLAMTLDDLRPLIEDRPAGKLADRVIPDYPGKTPPVLPAAWLEPLRSAKPASPPRRLAA